MTIELAPLALASPAPNPADSQSTKSSSGTGSASNADSKSDDKDGSASAGGFNAILNSVGQKSDKDAQVNAKKSKTDSAVKTSVDPNAAIAPGAPGAPPDPAQAQALALAAGIAAAGMVAPTVPSVATTASGEALLQGGAGATPETRKLVIGSATNAENTGTSVGLTDMAQESAGPLGASGKALQRAKVEKTTLQANANANANARESDASAVSAVSVESGTAGVSATASGKAEVQAQFDLKMFAAMQEQRGTPPASMPPVLALQESGKSEKSGGDSALKGNGNADTTYSAQSLGVSSNGYASNAPAAADPAQLQQVADQVKYWISQDVQNAHLKLDGLGTKPVEVSISMNGNEAHVVFRSDELQTRGVLESAGAQLKDMLLSQGVMLSGVSVGTSGSGGGGASDAKSRQGSKQGVINVIAANPVSARPSNGSPSGRSLDLFV
jgi:flagellar hook-length control protein FliK